MTWMSQVQGFGCPKRSTRKKKWAFQIFQQRKDQRTLEICTIEPGRLFKGEGIGVDMQELTESIENLNA